MTGPFCSFCGSELNQSDDGPEIPHSLGGKRTFKSGLLNASSLITYVGMSI